MSRATKEELFLMKLLEMGDQEVNPYEVGKALGQKEHAVDMIVKQLAQANFIKKQGDHITITPHGINIAEQIRQEVKQRV